MTPFLINRCPLWSATAIAALLAACGGGGGSDTGSSEGTQTPVRLTLSGQVIDGPIQGATVCLDLNLNGTCDSGEPVSSPTDAAGGYTIVGVTQAQIDTAPVVAMVPATAIDASNPGVMVGQAFRLSAPAGQGAVVSPITHMVQTGIVGGMTRAQAEQVVATQFQVTTGSLYQNFTAGGSADHALLNQVAADVVALLKSGVQPSVVVPSTSSPGYTVRLLQFTDARNYTLRYFQSDNIPDASGLYTFHDVRNGVSGGQALTSSSLYGTAFYLSRQGWVQPSAALANKNTAGSPYLSSFGTGHVYSGVRSDEDVAGQSLNAVVTRVQSLTQNTFSTLEGVNAAALTGTLPAGAKVRRATSRQIEAPMAYQVADGSVTLSNTVAGLPAAYPTPATPTGSNTVSLGNLHGSTCTSVCPQERLRAAFGSSNVVSYYLCDLNVTTNVSSNCRSVGTGTRTNGKAIDGVTPIMTFSGLPAEQAVQTYNRVFIERDGKVWFGWQDKPTTTTSMRLNQVAFQALAAALGIAAP